MNGEILMIVTTGVFLVAMLYSSVGHAGASGYIAVMSVCNLTPEVIKPTALVLNVLVATLATVQFWRAGHFSWRLFWPFAVFSAPLAFVGGWLNLSTPIFKSLVGLVLLGSAARFLIRPPAEREPVQVSKPVALGVGGGLGFLSGLTGTGGGIFLTPLLIWRQWASSMTAAGVSALFILMNSISGLLGHLSATKSIPQTAWPLVVAALAGGTIGSQLGSRHFSSTGIKRVLAAVLVVAGIKLLLF